MNMLKVGQPQYVEAILSDHGMENVNPVATPLPIGIQVEKCIEQGRNPSISNFDYPSFIGSVMFLMLCTHPDISFAISYLTKFMSKPFVAHVKAVKHLLHYLAGTKNYCLEYSAVGSTLLSYSDSGWAGDTSDHRYTTGWTFLLAGASLSWALCKQPTVALSSTEVEYMVATQVTKEAVWLHSLLTSIGFPHDGPTLIYSNNTGLITLSRNDTHHSHSKHINIQHHFVHEEVTSGEVTMEYVLMHDMTADVLTKPLAKELHGRMVRMLGMGKLEQR